jgi:hypothetical protein
MALPPRDYLKYYKVIRQYFKAKHKISQAELDVLIFMYSEGYFNRERFADFEKTLPWNKQRFQQMLKDGWFEVFRKKVGQRATIYQMSDKGKLLVADLYRKLNGQDIPVQKCNNPIFLKRKAKYSEKVYKDMIIEMNNFNKQQRHRSPE